jgi:hypothetical protein
MVAKGLGEGRRSIFIADETLGAKVFDYRATLVTGDRRVTVICFFPATNWTALEQAFARISESMRQGGT